MNGGSGDFSNDPLVQFFRELAESHELYNSYLVDPLQVMRDRGIPEDLIGAVLEGDLHHLHGYFVEKFGPSEVDQAADSGGVTFLFGTIVRW